MHAVSLSKQGMHRAHKLGAVQAVEDGEEAVNHSFIRQALQPLVSMLLDQLTKQEPGQDRDEGIWNLSMAAGTCLGLVAQCVKDEIVSLVMPYVQVGYNTCCVCCQCHAAAAGGLVCCTCFLQGSAQMHYNLFTLTVRIFGMRTKLKVI